MNEIIKIPKGSVPYQQVRGYLEKLLEVSQTGQQFPVDLDEVWYYAYSRKDIAINALRNGDFYEGSDFEPSQNMKVVSINQLQNGVKTTIKLSTSCFEYLIARKNRYVFEVYRQVFHKALTIPKDYPSALRALADQVEANQRLELQNVQQQKAIEVMAPKADFADQAFRLDSRINIGTCGKVLGLPFGRNTLFRKLRERGIFFSNRNEPKQRYVDAGYFTMGESYVHKGRAGFIVNVTYATQKGLAYIGYLFGKKPNAEQLPLLFAQAQRIDAQEHHESLITNAQ